MEQQDQLFLLGKIDANVRTLLARDVNHDKRIVSLEKSRSWVLGYAAAISAAMAIALKVLI